MKKILIIEDDLNIQIGLKDNLELEKYEVLTETDGQAGLNTAFSKSPDLIILDLMLPTKNGYDICRELRQAGKNTPILMLSVKADEADKVLGLELGADDYMTKPFSVKELLARIKAILRRRSSIEENIEVYTFSNIRIDFRKMETTKDNKNINLSLKEYEIMKFFIHNEDNVVSRDTLLDKVWGYEVFPTTRTIDNYILMLRKKLEDNPAVPKHIMTIHSVGYRFVK